MTRLLLLLCLTPTGCMTDGLWSSYRPVEDTYRGVYLQAALDPHSGPPRLLLRCAFPGSSESAVIAVTPPAQKLEILAPHALENPTPLLPGEPVTLGGFRLLLREDGPLEIEGAVWEWMLPEETDGTRASGMDEIATLDGHSTVLARLWYGTSRRFVWLSGNRTWVDDLPDASRAPFRLEANLRERGSHSTLEIAGATRILDRPLRRTLRPDHPEAARRGALTLFAAALDAATLPFQLPFLILFEP